MAHPRRGLLAPWRGEYTIDVSSPGPERPLRKPGHFEQAIGRTVALRTAEEVGGKRRVRGELRSTSPGGITLSTPAGEFEVPYESILRANLVEEGERTP